MTASPARVGLRGVAALAACVAGAEPVSRLTAEPVAVLLRPLLQDGPAALGQVPFDAALTGISAGVLLCCGVWLLVLTGLSVAAHVADELAPGSRAARRLHRLASRRVPAAVRRLLALVLGASVTAGLVAEPARADLDGLPLPDRTTGRAVTVEARTVLRPQRAVVVHRGDSLWSISAALLPAAARDATVTRAWHRLDRRNAECIGSDPDLILPGTRLVVPVPLVTPGEEAS